MLQAAVKGTIDELVSAVSGAAGSVADAAASLSKQHRPASPLQQRAANHQQALLSAPPTGVNAARQQLSNSLSVLHSAVAAAVLSSAAECDQTAVLGQQVEALQVQLRQAAAGQQELRGQLGSLQEQLATAEREADAVKMQLQEVGVGVCCCRSYLQPGRRGFYAMTTWFTAPTRVVQTMTNVAGSDPA